MEEFYDKREKKFIEAEIKEYPTSKTEIQNYYTDKTILLTGGSGFLGSLAIERLLRCCPDIRKLIIVLRTKRGKSLRQRTKELFNNEVFEKMRLSNPDYWKKVEILAGDCELPYYGWDSTEWNRLQQEVNIIFHSAATIRFDEHIKISYDINVGGTKYLLKLAEGAAHIDAFVFVSTAYSQSHLSYIEEKFYPSAYSDEQMMQLIDSLDANTLACMTPIILGGRFNTYVLMKGIAESIIEQYVGKLPVAVFRPSIVSTTFDDPLTSWTNSIAGSTGVFVGTAIGFLRNLRCDANLKAEIIPADRVISALLRIPVHCQKKAAFNQLTRNGDTNCAALEKSGRQPFIPIYNYTSKGKTICWGNVIQLFKTTLRVKKMEDGLILWTQHLKFDRNYTVWLIRFYLVHLVPLPLFLLMEKLAKMKPRLWKGYIQLYKYTNLLSFFMINSWDFSWRNTAELISFTSKEDDVLFNADCKIDWESYFYGMIVGIGHHVLHLDFNEHFSKLKKHCIVIADRLIVWTFKILVIWFLAKLIVYLVSSLSPLLTLHVV